MLKNFIKVLIDLIDLKGKFLLKKNKKLFNINKNKRCFVIATGTSLMEADLSLLKNEFKIGFGFGFLHHQIHDSFYDLYVLLDKYLNNNNNKSFPKSLNAENTDDQANKMYSYISKMNIPYLFINRENYYYVKKFFPKMLKNTYFFKCSLGEISKDKLDLTKRFNTYPSTMFASLQIALEMGFKEIYILGAGFTYTPRNLYHFYDGFIKDSSHDLDLVKSKASTFLNNRQNLNPNKKLNFKRLIKNNKKYYGLFTEHVSLDDPHYQAHAQIKLLAESYECDIFNVVPEGFESKIYKKIKWSDLEKKLC